jgi:uncharacterized protein (DUF2252 family)
VPRSSHGDWTPVADRPDPLTLLQAQDEGRIQQLLPIKYGRMLDSPFAFMRGSAVVMAADLAGTPTTGLQTMLCGDAHLSNFGVFATPERRLVFDINDFDEASPGPWEWDLKRLAASAVVAGRENGFSKKWCVKLATNVAETYRLTMDEFAKMHTLDVWYYHVSMDAVLDVFDKSSKQGRKSAKKMAKKARSHTHEQTTEKLTHFENGRRRINSDPPLLVPFREISLANAFSEEGIKEITEKAVADSWAQYLDSLPSERSFLLQRYRLSDVALRVGGIGSVGTRCVIVLLEGGAEDDALILQLKEAGPSVLEAYLPKRREHQHAERVVIGQRLMQAASDIFLGWHSSTISGRHYYWRQLKDMKGSLEVADMDEKGLQTYLKVCGLCLARAHARTGDAAAIDGYLGRSNSFAKAVTDFAEAYADQTERDYQALVDAVKSDRIAAATGLEKDIFDKKSTAW